MSFIRSASACLVGAAVSLAAVAAPTAASAADLYLKAKPPAPEPVTLDIHGYADVTFASTRVTGGGLYLYDRGYLTQIESGLALDLYKNKAGFINSVSVFGGAWSEHWSEPPPGGREWQEYDIFLGFSVGFARDWKFTAQHVQFVFPGGGATHYNYAFTLGYDDSWSGLPVTFNPFVTVFYNAAGGTNLPFGDNTYRVEIGMKPTVSFAKAYGVPLTLTFPTWFTVGPTDYWNVNTPATFACGAASNAPCELSNFGMVTTGIQAKYTLDNWVPKRLGTWYVKAGAQYYHIINDAALAAQQVVGTAASFPDTKRDIVVGTAGFGIAF